MIITLQELVNQLNAQMDGNHWDIEICDIDHQIDPEFENDEDGKKIITLSE